MYPAFFSWGSGAKIRRPGTTPERKKRCGCIRYTLILNKKSRLSKRNFKPINTLPNPNKPVSPFKNILCVFVVVQRELLTLSLWRKGGQHDTSLEKVNMCDYPQETILNFYKGKHEEFRRFGGVNKHLFKIVNFEGTHFFEN